MRIWSLENVRPITGHNDTQTGVVVVARSEDEARKLAAKGAFDEGADAWTDPKRSTCVAIGTAHPKFATAQVVLSAVYTG